eukprot:20486-Rhodomonas_salina.3
MTSHTAAACKLAVSQSKAFAKRPRSTMAVGCATSSSAATVSPLGSVLQRLKRPPGRRRKRDVSTANRTMG